MERRQPLRSQIAQVLFGPWPLRPILTWVFTSIVYQHTTTGVLVYYGEMRPLDVFTSLPQSALRGAAVIIPLVIAQVLHRRLFGDRRMSRAYYVTALLITSAWAATIRFWILDGELVTEEPALYVFYLLRAIVLVFTIHSALGIADARLRAQIDRADTALAMVSDQRWAVLEAEERARRSVARLLHDRVQAGLVAVMLQLRGLQREVPAATSARLGSLIEDMERLRAQDVRTASLRLSPDLGVTGLQPALEELAATYRPAMDTAIEVSVPFETWARIGSGDAVAAQLGAYRIIEQSLLNAAVHGAATRVEVTVAPEATGEVRIVVRDNGTGLQGEPVRGSGSVVTDAWTGTLGGTWSREPGESGGVVVTALLGAAEHG